MEEPRFRSLLKYMVPTQKTIFLVRSYKENLDIIEEKIREILEPEYLIKTGKDIVSGNLLENLYRMIKSSEFCIILLAGMKIGKEVRLNMPFEYGMVKGLGIPMILLLEENEKINLKMEFSDADGEVYKKINRRDKRGVKRKLTLIFENFEAELREQKKKEYLKEQIGKLPYNKLRKVEHAIDTIEKIMNT